MKNMDNFNEVIEAHPEMGIRLAKIAPAHSMWLTVVDEGINAGV